MHGILCNNGILRSNKYFMRPMKFCKHNVDFHQNHIFFNCFCSIRKSFITTGTDKKFNGQVRKYDFANKIMCDKDK